MNFLSKGGGRGVVRGAFSEKCEILIPLKRNLGYLLAHVGVGKRRREGSR